MEWVNFFIASLNVLFAYFLLRETIKLRKVETEPEISIFLEQISSGGNFNIVVKNIGKGAAYDIKFNYSLDPVDQEKLKYFKIEELGFFNGVKYMAPDQQYRTLFCGPTLFVKPLPTPLKFNVEYFNKSRKLITDDFIIDIGEYWGTFSLQTIKLEDINKSIIEISRNIAGLRK